MVRCPGSCSAEQVWSAVSNALKRTVCCEKCLHQPEMEKADAKEVNNVAAPAPAAPGLETTLGVPAPRGSVTVLQDSAKLTVLQSKSSEQTPADSSRRTSSLNGQSLLSRATFFSSPSAKRAHLADDPQGQVASSFWSRARNTFEVATEVVRRSPSCAIVPIIVFCVLCGLGVYGTIAGAQSVADNKKELAVSTATDVGTSFVLQVKEAYTPLISLQTYILQQPYFYQFLPFFPGFAKNLLAELPNGTIQELQVSPQGQIRATYPNTYYHSVGVDIFNETALRSGAVNTLKLKRLVLSGPLMLVVNPNIQPEPPRVFAGIARLPIFIANTTQNETWGLPKSAPTNCYVNSSDGCGNYIWNASSNTKFWGFVTALVGFDELTKGADSRLKALSDNGYRYILTRPANPGDNQSDPNFVIARSQYLPSDNSISITLNVSFSMWTLSVSPDSGWDPVWWPYVVAATVVVSLVIALLVAYAMIARQQQGWMLEEVIDANAQLAETTAKLEAEKVRTDALVVRQYNLIELFGKEKNSKRGTSEDSPLDSSRRSSEALTMDRVEAVRRQLHNDNAKALSESENIQTLELLGQGTFGKVYKGMWRGTIVAIKTMVLPANMSGAEKREKMAVMEAAISTSCAHPNIVQTYTYSIKPIREADSVASIIVSGAAILGPDGSTMRTNNHNGGSDSDKELANSMIGDATPTAIHSYEIRLVLEYCDKGCLRDALDQGAFMTDEGLNYRAILETAADIAKAMLHLHSTQVLHSDLKVANVMLKSSGDSRSIVAKVADFGLSLRMEHTETHMSNVYHGTLTHMAPEIMLEGRVSKAADVYAFGITMWELFTSGHAYQGTPRALLGHQIARDRMRPKFPLACPANYRELAERCWDQSPERRPAFEEILIKLLRMREELGGEARPVRVDTSKPSASIKPKASPWVPNKSPSGDGSGRTLNLGSEAGVIIGGASSTSAPPLQPPPPGRTSPNRGNGNGTGANGGGGKEGGNEGGNGGGNGGGIGGSGSGSSMGSLGSAIVIGSGVGGALSNTGLSRLPRGRPELPGIEEGSNEHHHLHDLPV